MLLILTLVVNSGGNIKASSSAVETDLKGKITDLGSNFFKSYFGLSENESSQNNSATKNENNTETNVYLGGFPIGIKLYCDGVIIVDTQDVAVSGGYENPAQKAGLLKGDIIKSVNGKKVSRNSEVSELIEESNGKQIKMQILRNGELKNIVFSSVYSTVSGQYKAGLWIRDSSAGIGTVTFYTEDGEFASLGHAVCDVDTGEMLPIESGETTNAKITGFYKGKVGTAGELCGILETKTTGEIMVNDGIGIYGVFDSVDTTRTLYPLAQKNEVKTGSAQIVTTIENGNEQTFNIEIERIDYASTEHKNLVIKVTDENLINKTGGIVQGMSGSPILQNGKIIGAVTHVFLNDPTGGYGIFAETMLETADGLANGVSDLEKAS
ncbi:MAG: SpoIVB peptidase [Clostridia bacterium]|nr:SpoIVB peptidase [Clostridia bacterium]